MVLVGVVSASFKNFGDFCSLVISSLVLGTVVGFILASVVSLILPVLGVAV